MSGLCGKFPIKIDQGANFFWIVTYEDSDGNPIDLTDYIVEMQVRQTVEDSETILALSSEGVDPAITIDAEDGKITINVPADVTAELEAPLDAVYDIKITSPASFVERILEGPVCISAAVTRELE